MKSNNSGIARIIIIVLAIASLVLAVVHVNSLRSEGGSGQTIQNDISDYGNEQLGSDDIYYEDDGTLEMDSIPNGVLTSGSDLSASDAE